MCYGFQCEGEVSAGRMEGNADRSPPPLEQWHQVVHEGEVRMSGVGDCFLALKRPFSAHIIIQHPIVSALLSLRHQRLVQALSDFLHFFEERGRRRGWRRRWRRLLFLEEFGGIGHQWLDRRCCSRFNDLAQSKLRMSKRVTYHRVPMGLLRDSECPKRPNFCRIAAAP